MVTIPPPNVEWQGFVSIFRLIRVAVIFLAVAWTLAWGFLLLVMKLCGA